MNDKCNCQPCKCGPACACGTAQTGCTCGPNCSCENCNCPTDRPAAG